MMKYIQNPNLPQSKVKILICGTEDEAVLDYFRNNDISVIGISPNINIDNAVSTHADMALLHLGNNVVIADKNQTNLSDELQALGIVVNYTQKEIFGNYPSDVALNFAVVGNYVIGNFKYADENLMNMIADKKRINVKQGYCKCSVLIVDENAVITDDESIYRKTTENGIEALLVSKGDISLPGYEYGFIGGASGKISKNTIVFFGDISKHDDFEKIVSFIESHDCKYVCTDNKKLRDIGGFISVIEE